MKRWICILLLGLVQGLWAYPALAQGVNAFVDRDTVAENETLRLVIEVSGRGPSSDPDWSPLSQNFQVLGTAKSNQVNITNGTMEAKTRWTVTLAPQKTGSLTIPALTVGDQQTQAIVIKVTEAGAASTTDATPDIFIESEVKPDTAYVQQQLTYVLRIYYAVTPHGPQLSDPKAAADALIERLGDDRQYTTQRGDRRYGVIERQYAIFPQSSGTLSIESPIFSAQVPDTRQQSNNNNFFGQGGFLGPDSFNSLFQTVRPVQVRGQPFQITVKPRPSNSGGGAWLPAESLTVTESWSTDPPTFRVGEPVTRTLTLKARGLTGAQLPELPLPSSADLKLYPDRSATDTQANTGVVVGQREQKIALVPTRPGTFQLPEIRIPWWDTQADAPREAIIPAREITVTGVPAPSTPTQSIPAQQATKTPAATVEPNANATPAPQKSPPPVSREPVPQQLSGTLFGGASYWPWIALALLVAWIATLLLWWRARSQVRTVSPSADAQEMGLSQREALRELKQACQANDAERTKKALLHWARMQWPDHPPRSVLGIAERIDHQDARHALTAFDRCLYQDGGRSWNGETFYRDVSDVLQAKAARMQDGPKGQVLPELYPA